jgi:predicted signal transduction protein with EAL and GGDEF domain
MHGLMLTIVNAMMVWLLAGLFILLWFKRRAQVELPAFALAYALSGASLLCSRLIAFEGAAAYHAMMHGFYVAILLALGYGLAFRSRRPVPVLGGAGVVAAGTILLLISMVSSGSLSTGVYITNICYGVLSALIAMTIAPVRRHSGIDTILFWLVCILSAQFFLRPIALLLLDGTVVIETYRSSIYYSLLTALSAGMLIALALALMAGSVQDQMRTMRREAETDHLTGLPTRKAFEARVLLLLEQAERENAPVSLIVADIDHFKQVNDLWGHQAGDEAIARFGQMIHGAVRRGDIIGRIGGEEFCIVV